LSSCLSSCLRKGGAANQRQPQRQQAREAKRGFMFFHLALQSGILNMFEILTKNEVRAEVASL
jgi:hypothetical protein